MAVTMQQVQTALDPDEPGYQPAAQNLGPEALPFLEEIIRRGNEGLAAKAVYLASLIPDDHSSAVVEVGAGRPEAGVRVAVAAGALNLTPRLRGPVLLRLLDDGDVGVKKVALRAVDGQSDAALKAKVEAMAKTEAETGAAQPRAGDARPGPLRNEATTCSACMNTMSVFAHAPAGPLNCA